MAIVEMQKLRLIGLNEERQKVLNLLHKLSCVEVIKTEEIADLQYDDNTADLAQVNQRISDIEFAMSFIKEKIIDKKAIAKKQKDKSYKPAKKPFFFVRREVFFDEFAFADADEFENFAEIDKLKCISARLADIKTDVLRYKNLIEQLRVFSDLDVGFDDIKNTRSVKMSIGVLPISIIPEMEQIFAEYPTLSVQTISKTSANAVVFIMAHTSEYDTAVTKLIELGYSICSLKGKNPLAQIEGCKNNIEKLLVREAKLNEDVLYFEKFLKKFELLYDYYNLEREKAVCKGEFKVTDKTFILEGWMPKEQTARISKEFEESSLTTFCSFRAPNDDEMPPTCLRNKKLVDPYENVVNMYSSPNYREGDPNLFVGMFFFLFFGMMLSDAGYGIILAVVGLIALKFLRLEKGTHRMLAIITMGGVSTFIWGTVFGGWFGIELPADSFFNKIKWFSPMEEPLLMLGLCLGLGLLHILFGMGIRGYYLIKSGKVWDAIFDIGSWYIFFLGLIFVIIGMLGKIPVIQTIGFITAGVGLLIVIATNGRKAKGIFGKVLGGFKGLYSIINYMSDILSYARLFGLGLATGVIGMVMNTVAELFFGNALLIPIGVMVLIVGHAFNIGINVLGAYVHTCRLHYIEFFSRFYEGGGKLFNPLGSNMKYVNIVDRKTPPREKWTFTNLMFWKKPDHKKVGN